MIRQDYKFPPARFNRARDWVTGLLILAGLDLILIACLLARLPQ